MTVNENFLACKAVKYTNLLESGKKNPFGATQNRGGLLSADSVRLEVVGTVPEIFFFPIFAFVHRSLT